MKSCSCDTQHHEEGGGEVKLCALFASLLNGSELSAWHSGGFNPMERHRNPLEFQSGRGGNEKNPCPSREYKP
jgi:hypothetical protein